MLSRVPGVSAPLRGGEAGRDPLHAQGSLPTTSSPAPVARRTSSSTAPSSGPPWTTVTSATELHRHPGRRHGSRSRSPAERERADLQYIIQRSPGHRRDHAARADSTPNRSRSSSSSGHNQVAFDAVCCESSACSRASGAHPLAEDRGFGRRISRRSRSRHVAWRAGPPRQGLRGRPGARREVLRGLQDHRLPGPRPRRAHRLLLGRLPCAVEEAIEILRVFDKECDASMRRLHVSSAPTAARSTPSPARRSSSSVTAQLGGLDRRRVVSIRSTYKDRSTKIRTTPRTTTSSRRYHVNTKFSRPRRRPGSGWRAARLGRRAGAGHVEAGGTKNPYFDGAEALDFNKAYLTWRLVTATQRVMGKKYQEAAPATGHAARTSRLLARRVRSASLHL